MQNNFVERKIAEVGNYGGTFYDEVKIKEGLLFDPSSLVLIGFTGLKGDDNPQYKGTLQNIYSNSSLRMM